MRLQDLPGLGPKSAQQLQAVGITSVEVLRELGAVAAYVRLQQAQGRVSLNFLYALEGALQNCHWTQVARTERGRLLLELEGYQALEQAP